MRHRAPVLVGRDPEVRSIEQLLEAARAGRGGAAFVVGESGVGKSRLASMAADMAFREGMALMRGRGSSVGTAMPLRAVTEAVLSLVRARPIDLDALGPYRPILGRVVPGWNESRMPGTSAESPPEPTAVAADSPIILAEAVLRLAEVAGRDAGCLMLFDDLQDADAESLAVLEYLVDNVDQQRAVLLGAIMSGDSAAWNLARSASRRDRCLIMRLAPLDLAHTTSMVGACLSTTAEHIPPPVLDLVWTGSGGNPYLVEELLASLIDGGVLAAGSEAWRLVDDLPSLRSGGFARTLMDGIMARISAPARLLVSIAALLGERFPLAVVQAATGMTDRDLLNHLHSDVLAHLLTPDEQTTDWYAFRHRLSRESILAVLSPSDRNELARTAVKAIDAIYPALPGEWCQISAGLQMTAGNTAQAAARYAEAGRRALTEGAASSAVALLDQAWHLVDEMDPPTQAMTLETLIWALAEAGQVERALASVRLVDQLEHIDATRRVRLHTRLAWAAAVAGRVDDARAQVQAARRLLGPDADDAETAPVDVVAAHLALDTPGQDRLSQAEELARRAAVVAEGAGLPGVSCQAWQLLGALIRHRDPDEATQCLERARSIAARHRLPIWEIHALIRLGNDDALRDANMDRLALAHRRATEVGAVTARYQAESSIAFHAILRGEYDLAESLISGVQPAAQRLRLEETNNYLFVLRAMLAAHQGRRVEMEEALAQLPDSTVDDDLHTARIYGLARAFCSLLEEDRAGCLRELAVARAAEQRSPAVFHLSGQFGLHLLLQALEGELDWPELQARSSTPASRLRWDRQFAGFARAVLLGRQARGVEAAHAVAQAMEDGRPYDTARNLGLRLVSEAALADGWGTPAEWLRPAEEHFDRLGVVALRGACQAMLRQAGARVSQRRPGVSAMTPALRESGITAREFEVLRLLAKQWSNREIAQHLYLSHRTVERHISNLLQKTGLNSRHELSRLVEPEPQ